MRPGRAARILGAALAAVLLCAASAAAQLRIVAATSDLQSLAAAVAGDFAAVESIVPAGADPEAFEPRPGDLAKLRGADLVIQVGIGYDHWIEKLAAQLGDPRRMRGGEAWVDASLGIPFLEAMGRSPLAQDGHAHGQANPHYWLDPANAEIVTAGIVDGIARVAPAERDRAIVNRERFLAALRAKLAAWQSTLAPYEGAPLVAYHNSWPYFARRFRLNLVGFIELKEGVAPSPSHLAALITEARSKGVRAVLHEPYEPEDASRLVSQRLGVPMVAMATSVGSRPGIADYIGLFDYNVRVLAEALAAPGH
jgi:ABC-type Zn uptake system ZnuABC Zn-binding protein ZnuA